MNDVNYFSLLMNARTQTGRRSRLARAEVERMQVSVEVVDHPADVRIGTQQ